MKSTVSTKKSEEHHDPTRLLGICDELESTLTINSTCTVMMGNFSAKLGAEGKPRRGIVAGTASASATGVTKGQQWRSQIGRLLAVLGFGRKQDRDRFELSRTQKVRRDRLLVNQYTVHFEGRLHSALFNTESVHRMLREENI